MSIVKRLLPISALSIAAGTGYAAPPALTTASFMKHDLTLEQCQQSTKEIMDKMNLEIESHGNGTVGGFGEQSVAVVNCHRLADATYVQIAVASQKQEAAETIMRYLTGYLRSRAGNPASPPGPITKPGYPQ